MGHLEHHMKCGCPMCAGRDIKKKLLLAMVLFCILAIVNAMIAAAIHLKLHARELFHK